jgi:ABC-type transporter Mla subunit MlaD
MWFFPVLSRKLDLILQKLEALMTIADDLKTAVDTLVANQATLDASVQAETAAIAQLIANAGGNLSTADQASIQASISNIQSVSAKMLSDAQSLTSSMPPSTATKSP